MPITIPQASMEQLQQRVDYLDVPYVDASVSDEHPAKSAYNELISEYPELAGLASCIGQNIRASIHNNQQNIRSEAMSSFTRDPAAVVNYYDSAVVYSYSLTRLGYEVADVDPPFAHNAALGSRWIDSKNLTFEAMFSGLQQGVQETTEHYPDLLIAVTDICSRRLPGYAHARNAVYLSRCAASVVYLSFADMEKCRI